MVETATDHRDRTVEGKIVLTFFSWKLKHWFPAAMVVETVTAKGKQNIWTKFNSE